MRNNENNEQYPKGYFVMQWMGIGIAIFSGLGIPLSVVLDKIGFIGLGPAIGVSVGLAIGQSIENKYEKAGKIRPLNEKEKRKQRIATIAGLVIFALGALTIVLILLNR